MNEDNKIFKTNEFSIEISPVKNTVDSQRAQYYSYDENSGLQRIHILKDGQPLGLSEGSQVRLSAVKLSGSKQMMIYTPEIEDRVNGIVTFVIPKEFLGYSGQIRCTLYIDFSSDQTLHAGYFYINMGISDIDANLPEFSDSYWQRWTDFESEATTKMQELEQRIDEQTEIFNNADVYNKAEIEDKLEPFALRTDIDTLETKKADKTSLAKTDAEVAVARGGFNTLDERLTTKEQEVKAQLAQKPSRAEVYLKKNGININDWDEETRRIILDMEPGEINAVLGPENVKKENLDVELKKSLFFGGTLSNANIRKNISDYTFDSEGNLSVSQPATGTYKWVLFDVDREIEYTLPSNSQVTDSWLVLGEKETGEILATKIFSQPNLATGHTRLFTETNRTELLTGDASINPALEPGDRIRISREGFTYTFTIKRKSDSEYTLLLQLTIPPEFTSDLRPYFGFLSPKETSGIVAHEAHTGYVTTAKDVIESFIEERKAQSRVVDLIMFMGQSNMAGRGTAIEAPTVPEGQGYEFRAISDPTRLYPIQEPFGKNENKSSGISETTKTGSLVSAFSVEYYKHTKIPIVGVSASKGGSSINQWQPNTTFLNDAIERFHTAKNWLESNDYSIRKQSIVWCQGETDGDNSMPKDEYKEKLKNMIDEMLSQGIEACYIIRIGNHRDNDTLYDPIIQAQTELAQTHDHAVLVSTKFDRMATDGLMKDQFHYAQEGYNVVGEEAGKNTAFHINTGIEPYMFDWENQELYFSYK